MVVVDSRKKSGAVRFIESIYSYLRVSLEIRVSHGKININYKSKSNYTGNAMSKQSKKR